MLCSVSCSASPGLTAKKLHKKLVEDAAWASASVSEVKKACSKVAKRGLHQRASAPDVGAPAAATVVNSDAAADSLLDSPSKRIGKLGAMNVCTIFAGALFKHLTGDPGKNVGRLGDLTGGKTIPALGLYSCLAKPPPGKHSVCFVSLGQVGHDMILELATDSSGALRARPFSAWVASDAGNEDMAGKDPRRVQKRTGGVRGYTASEWASDASRCRWWSEVRARTGVEPVVGCAAATEEVTREKHCSAFFDSLMMISHASAAPLPYAG